MLGGSAECCTDAQCLSKAVTTTSRNKRRTSSLVRSTRGVEGGSVVAGMRSSWVEVTLETCTLMYSPSTLANPLSCTTLYSMSPLTLRIRELREKQGWSQAELGRRAGVAASVVNRIERRGTIALATLEKLARALGVPPRSLLKGP